MKSALSETNLEAQYLITINCFVSTVKPRKKLPAKMFLKFKRLTDKVRNNFILVLIAFFLVYTCVCALEKQLSLYLIKTILLPNEITNFQLDTQLFSDSKVPLVVNECV